MITKFRHKFCGKSYKVITGNVAEIAKKRLNTAQYNGLMKVGKATKVFGFCEWPQKRDKALVLDSELTGLALLETAIDEGIHACDFSISNPKVGKMAEALSTYLWKLGFRQTHSIIQEDASDSSHTRKVK